MTVPDVVRRQAWDGVVRRPDRRPDHRAQRRRHGVHRDLHLHLPPERVAAYYVVFSNRVGLPAAPKGKNVVPGVLVSGQWSAWTYNGYADPTPDDC